LAAAALWLVPMAADAKMSLPESDFEWVQSTTRQDYFFNKRYIHYGVDANGYVDINKIVVPTIRVYDAVQIEDVVSKRRWNGLPLDGYGDLAGAAEYLVIDLLAKTVQITKHDDLDSEMGTIATDKPTGKIDMNKLSDKDVDGKFYAAIIEYADKHDMEMALLTPGILSDATKKVLLDRHKTLSKEELEKQQRDQQRELEKLTKQAKKKEAAEARKKADEAVKTAEKAEQEAKNAADELAAYQATIAK